MQLSSSDTKAYFSLRTAIMKNVKKGMIKQMYLTFYNLMSTGSQTVDGRAGPPGSAAEGANLGSNTDFLFIPNCPSKRVNDFALKAARTMEALVLECIAEIMPKDYYELAASKAQKKSDLQLL